MHSNHENEFKSIDVKMAGRCLCLYLAVYHSEASSCAYGPWSV